MSSNMNRLPSLFRSTPPSPRTPSVTRMPRTLGGQTIPVGWNCTNSMSSSAAPALYASAWPSPVYSQLLLVILIRAADAACSQHRPLSRVNRRESAAFTVVAEGAGDAVAVLQQREDRGSMWKSMPLMDAVILQGADHFQAGAVADVRQARIAVAAEIALEDPAVARAVEYRAPGLEFPHAFRRFLRMQLGHAPVVHVLPAAHGVGEVNAPAVAVVDVAHRRGHSALRPSRCAPCRAETCRRLRPSRRRPRPRWRRADRRRPRRSPARHARESRYSAI